MSERLSLKPSSDDDDEPMADPSGLFGDLPASSRGPGSVGGSSATGSVGDGYDVLGQNEEPETDLSHPAPVPRSVERVPPPKAQSRPEPSERGSSAGSDQVDEVWTRWAEWGGTIRVLAMAAVGCAIVFYLSLSFNRIGLSLLVLAISAVVLAYFAYPIMITMERPVRTIPEQALKDYFDALSHHFPHYRRMWLILTAAGKACPTFSSFTQFAAYWTDKLAVLRPTGVSKNTPLEFRVEDFKSEKSVGKKSIDVEFRVDVYVRGKEQNGPIASFPREVGLVKGPDDMWYLGEGSLPEPTRRKGSAKSTRSYDQE